MPARKAPEKKASRKLLKQPTFEQQIQSNQQIQKIREKVDQIIRTQGNKSRLKVGEEWGELLKAKQSTILKMSDKLQQRESQIRKLKGTIA